MRIAETSDLWWKNAVIYCLDVETFFDDDGDGTGDFAGLTQRVDYLAALGVSCIWLMPFYPSPDRDDGYDVTDFYGVDHRLGTMGDLVEFIRTAKDRGETGLCIVAGPTCDSADVLYEKTPYPLPVSLAIGDKVIIEAAGAYTASYSSVGFNGYPPLRQYVI